MCFFYRGYKNLILESVLEIYFYLMNIFRFIVVRNVMIDIVIGNRKISGVRNIDRTSVVKWLFYFKNCFIGSFLKCKSWKLLCFFGFCE